MRSIVFNDFQKAGGKDWNSLLRLLALRKVPLWPSSVEIRPHGRGFYVYSYWWDSYWEGRLMEQEKGSPNRWGPEGHEGSPLVSLRGHLWLAEPEGRGRRCLIGAVGSPELTPVISHLALKLLKESTASGSTLSRLSSLPNRAQRSYCNSLLIITKIQKSVMLLKWAYRKSK